MNAQEKITMKSSNHFIAGTLLAVALCACPLFAEHPSTTPAPKPTPPSGPLVQKNAPTPSFWTVVIKTAPSSPVPKKQKENSSNAESADQLSSTNSTAVHVADGIIDQKTYLKQRDYMKVTLGGGPNAVSLWEVKGKKALEWPGGRFALFSTLGPNPFQIDLSHGDFSDLNWINRDSYVGEGEYHGIKCLIYKGNAQLFDKYADQAGPDSSIKKSAVYAYVEIQTRLPVAMISEQQVTEWNWQQPPSGSLSVPPAIFKMFENQEKQNKQMLNQAVK
jgi:hypothetical protein